MKNNNSNNKNTNKIMMDYVFLITLFGLNLDIAVISSSVLRYNRIHCPTTFVWGGRSRQVPSYLLTSQKLFTSSYFATFYFVPLTRANSCPP